MAIQCGIARMDMTKALAELDVLRGFIDFVNRQVGVYCDCLSSFYGNKVCDDTQKIWRYMDFAKFISLLANEALFFPCPCRFNDRFEGYATRSDIETLSKMAQPIYKYMSESLNNNKKTHPDKDYSELDCLLKKLPETAKAGPDTQRFGVSCWHKSEYESEAMWKLYSKSGQAIAIESTVKQLREAIINKDGVTIDSVRYLDFDKDTKDKRHPLFQKRKSFEHEKELRASILLEEKDYGKGAFVKCDLNSLINKIHVSPFVEAFIKDDIEKLCSGKIQMINKPVIHSPLFNPPDYWLDIT
jgi:hypothetical protein